MPRGSRSKSALATPKVVNTTKYDAHHRVLENTYGSFADLRRELADSREKVAEREAVLKQLAETPDTQRAYLLFDDYLEKLALRRNDFGIHDWWGRIQAASGRQRLEEVAMLFLRSSRSLPTELLPYANFEKFAEVEQSEKETGFVTELENWLLPPNHSHLDSPRAALRVAGEPLRTAPDLNQWRLAVRFFLFRSRSGEKERQIPELCELRTRAAHEAELFP
ncbi:MAG: ATP-dependent helicase, partial [Verrucomicrobiota bacterium]